jgi:uncharacterized protein (DUF488 family)
VRRLATVGGYGFTEHRFLEVLHQAGVDALVDVRQRRGVRGPAYRFLNRARFEALLRSAGIAYIYAPELAPTTAIRAAQAAADAEQSINKRNRVTLSPTFVDRYAAEVLEGVDVPSFLKKVERFDVVALFCVEKVPSACHRSLAADYIADQTSLDAPVEHLLP